jgi:hypothetical protein
MTDYTKVTDAMRAGIDPALICATCPWDRLCITPPAVTSEEIEQAVKKAEEADEQTRMLTITAVMAGRDTMGSLCPVFAAQLRSPDGRELADAIRNLLTSSPRLKPGVSSEVSR